MLKVLLRPNCLISYKNTYNTFLKLKKDITQIQRITSFLAQVIFLAYNIYLLFSNLNNITYLIIYSILFLISLFYFIFDLLLLFSKNKYIKRNIKHKVNLIVKAIKYIIKLTIIILAIIEIFSFDNTTDLKKLTTIISIVTLFIQILIDLITRFITNYIDLFIESLKLDYENSSMLKEIKKGYDTYNDIKENCFKGVTNLLLGKNDNNNDITVLDNDNNNRFSNIKKIVTKLFKK